MGARAQQSAAMTTEPPVYVRVADLLEDEIASLADGEPLPSEHELARNHQINRLTARAALIELERRHLVRRQQGRRTIVARRIAFRLDPHGAPGWTKVVRKSGALPRTEVEAVRERRATSDVHEMLGTKKSDVHVYLARRRYVDDELAAYSESWLAAAAVPDFERRLADDASLARTLRAYDLRVKQVSLRCELVVAGARIAAKLQSPDRPLVFALQTLSRARKKPLALTTTWLRADIFNVIFEVKNGGR